MRRQYHPWQALTEPSLCACATLPTIAERGKLITIWGALVESVKQRIASYFESVNEQAPFLGYLGIAFWSAWILSTSGVQDWLSPSSGAESTFSSAYVETRVVLIAALIGCAILGNKLSQLFESGRAIPVTAAMAVAGDVCLATSWLVP